MYGYFVIEIEENCPQMFADFDRQLFICVDLRASADKKRILFSVPFVERLL
jgi:hypothetical protein